MSSARSIRLWLRIAASLLLAPMASAVTIDWVTVGDPGNDADMGCCFGAVADTYRIDKHEITNAQYTEFLNAVAATDTNALYNTNMGNPLPQIANGFGGIARSGSSGSFTYSAIADREDMPVNWVSFWDATRFANWLHNGQPTGAQDDSTTEDGAYTLTPAGITSNSVTRNSGATAFIPSEHEWYKAAYYKGGGINSGYWDYPAGSDTQTSCAAPGASANTANCLGAAGDLTIVGSYTGSASPSGTFDQGGNVWEWIEDRIVATERVQRGGYLFGIAGDLAASARGLRPPATEDFERSFRVASLAPASAVPALGPLGIALLLAALGATAYWRLRESDSAA